MGKLLTLLLAAVVAVALLAGCGGDDDDDSGDGGAAATTTETADADDGGGGGDSGSLELTIEQFDDGGEIPTENTCDGEGTAPLVQISGTPDDAAELALLVNDPDAPGGDFFHWGVVGIDPNIASFGPLGPPAQAVETANDADGVGYAPPCPPEGDGPHRYVFTVYALSEPVDLEEGVAPGKATDAVEAASIAEASVTGTYER